jgi:hypothetical protein
MRSTLLRLCRNKVLLIICSAVCKESQGWLKNSQKCDIMDLTDKQEFDGDIENEHRRIQKV